MAEESLRYGLKSGSEHSEFGMESSYSISVSDINACADEYIMPYSKITKVLIHAEAYQTIALGSTKSDMRVYLRDNAANIKKKFVYAVEGVPKDKWTTFEVDATSSFITSGQNIGHVNVSGATKLVFQNQAMVARTLKLRECYVRWYWNTPTYTISVKSSGGGTVSGGGTFDVTTADQTKTITATPNSGYKFVKWTDSNGKTYTTASLNVTISQNSISAHSTSVTYTATFEPISYTVTVTAGTGGTVSGGGTYTQGSTATLKATPNSGYKFVKWNDGNTSNPRTVTVSGNATYTATFEKDVHTVSFKNQDGTTVKTSQIQSGSTLGTLPTVSRSGYTFAGWIPCEPAKKTDGTVLDSYKYNGDSSSVHALDKKYKYTNKLSVHIEAYMSNWEDIKNLKSQIISCTESGGWGLGYQANTNGNGAEIYAGGYKGVDLGFNTPSNFSNNTWYSFDIVFKNGTFEAYLNGVKKGTQTTSSTTITYNSENTIFVGAEAGKSASTPAGNYFKGFISNVFIANQSTRLQIATTSTVVDKDIEYYPVWRINTTRTATFKNYDGTVLQTLQVEYGRTPSYTGPTPTRATTAEYTYIFSGWNPSVGAITSNTEYVAQFTATKRKYTITVSGTNGSVSGGGTYEYNSSVTLTATPNTGYKFVKWSDGILNATRTISVTRDETYTAYFGINRVLADNSKAKKIMLNLDKVKALLLHNTKVYES